MPAVSVPVTTITRSAAGGTIPPAVVDGDPVNGHSVANDGGMWLEVDNVDAGAPHVLTADYAQRVDGQAVTDRVYTIPASAVARRIGPFPPSMFGDTLTFTVDAADLKLRAFRLGR